MFKKISILLSVSLLVLTACSGGGGGGGGGGGQPTDPTSDSKKEPTSDSKKEPTSDTPRVLPVVSYKLPDTGQTRSYTNTRGEDSDYTNDSPSYTVYPISKVVLDNNTGLMWEQLPDAKDHVQKNHADAITHCGAQTTNGYSDWRLPNKLELESIINFGRNSPAIDPTTFPNTQTSEYWSSTSNARNASFAWIVIFDEGLSSIDTKSNTYYVRCVRLSPTEPTTRFTNNGDETITDQKTGLIWQQLPDAGDHTTTRTWEDALRYCEGLTFAGHSNWRLPNKKELLSIVDSSRSNPSIDPTAFPNTQSSYYWSSTVNASATPNAWGVNFISGVSSPNSRTTSRGRVRCVRAPSYKLPDTGQTTGYTNTRGEDADYTINPPSYTVDAAKKTVFDNNTLLMWEQLPDAGNHERKTYAEAITHCEDLTFAGHSDWRLPSIDELESIVNFGRPNPAIYPSTFPNTRSSNYWSSTIYAPSTSNAWIVNFGIGFVDIKDRNNISYIRCVRLSSTEPTTRFTDNSDETITDKKTGLMWQQLPDAADHNTTYTWENALTRCEGLTFAGHSNWRLPNTKELFSIADLSRSNPAIDPSTFPNTRSSNYWSSTVYVVPGSSDAWLLDFNTGNSSSSNRSTTRSHVRCVRSTP